MPLDAIRDGSRSYRSRSPRCYSIRGLRLHPAAGRTLGCDTSSSPATASCSRSNRQAARSRDPNQDRAVERPLFPRYGFIAFDHRDTVGSPIRYTPGVAASSCGSFRRTPRHRREGPHGARWKPRRSFAASIDCPGRQAPRGMPCSPANGHHSQATRRRHRDPPRKPRHDRHDDVRGTPTGLGRCGQSRGERMRLPSLQRLNPTRDRIQRMLNVRVSLSAVEGSRWPASNARSTRSSRFTTCRCSTISRSISVCSSASDGSGITRAPAHATPPPPLAASTPTTSGPCASHHAGVDLCQQVSAGVDGEKQSMHFNGWTGGRREGAGRPKGVPNKINADLKEMILGRPRRCRRPGLSRSAQRRAEPRRVPHPHRQSPAHANHRRRWRPGLRHHRRRSRRR